MNELSKETRDDMTLFREFDKMLQRYAYSHLLRRAILRQWMNYRKQYSLIETTLGDMYECGMENKSFIECRDNLKTITEIENDDDFFLLTDSIIELSHLLVIKKA